MTSLPCARRRHYELSQVTRTYAGAHPVHALVGCDLAIGAGEYVSIVGTSGSGKSTLLNLLGMIDAPTSGSMLVDGIEVSGLSDSARTEMRGRLVGFVFQSFHLLRHRTALENVSLPMIYQGVSRSERLGRSAMALERVGLAGRMSALPSTLSGGEAQRVAIARAVAGNPGIVLCDEPTGNLDQGNTEQVMSLLEELNADGLTIVVVSHDETVARRARRVVSVADGVVSG
jgi:putative ABC transport system ATP-binding protein